MNYRIILPTGKQMTYFESLLPQSIAEDKENMYIGAIDEDNEASGILAFRMEHLVIELVYISVYESCRQQKVATMMLNYLIDALRKKDELFCVNCTYPLVEEYEGIDKTLRSNANFIVTDSESYIVISKDEREKALSSIPVNSGKLKYEFFEKISSAEKRRFAEKLKELEIGYIDLEEKGILSDISICSVTSEGQISSCLLFREGNEEEIELSFGMTIPGYERDFISLLLKASELMSEKYPERNLTINMVNEKSDNLVTRIFGEKVSRTRICSAISLG